MDPRFRERDDVVGDGEGRQVPIDSYNPSFPRKRESIGFADRPWTLAFARVTMW
jgi:hypothetical protein